MVEKLQERLQKIKTDRKYRGECFLTLLIGIAFGGFILFTIFCVDPTRLITKYLRDNNYQYNQDKIELVSLGHNTYKLINPPIDPATNVVLENWKIESWGGTFSVGYTFAIPLDLPKEEYQTVSWSMDFTDEEFQILSDKAEQEQLSVQEYITRKIMELISSDEMSTS